MPLGLASTEGLGVNRVQWLMGFLSNLRTASRMTQAAAAIQNLLEVEAACGAFKGSTKEYAEKLVSTTLHHPSVADWIRRGEQPHYMLLACASLSNGLRYLDSVGEANVADSLHRCLRLLVASPQFPGAGSGKADSAFDNRLREIAFLAFEEDGRSV
jgi:hypothetical protein